MNELMVQPCCYIVANVMLVYKAYVNTSICLLLHSTFLWKQKTRQFLCLNLLWCSARLFLSQHTQPCDRKLKLNCSINFISCPLTSRRRYMRLHCGDPQTGSCRACLNHRRFWQKGCIALASDSCGVRMTCLLPPFLMGSCESSCIEVHGPNLDQECDESTHPSQQAQ